METTLIIISILTVLYAAYCTVKFLKWRKIVTKPKFYNKQGQECSQAEMEAELTWKLEKSLIRPIPSEEAFD